MKKWFSIVSLALIAAILLAVGGNAVTAQEGTATPEASDSTIPGSGLVTGPAEGEATRLNASGATFPLALYTKWVEVYKGLTNVEINYAGGGSGQGKKDIAAQAVDFAGSDSVMTDEEITAATGGHVLHIATTLGGIVPIYNIPELKDKAPLKLTGDQLAQIYLGKISKWNDPILVAENPDLASIDWDIQPVYRSDGSGTTNNFTKYLAASNQEWADTIKSGNTVQWPIGRGANGNPGVAQEVSMGEYTIGYVELAFAKDIQSAQVQNAAGNYVTASADSISAAADGVELAIVPHQVERLHALKGRNGIGGITSVAQGNCGIKGTILQIGVEPRQNLNTAACFIDHTGTA